MAPPLFYLSRRALGAAAVALLAFAGDIQAQTTPFYNATNLTGNTQTGVVHYLQYLSPEQGPGTYSLSTFQLSVNFNMGVVAQGVVLTFYTGANLSPTAANALAGATNIGSYSTQLGPEGIPGSFLYTRDLMTTSGSPAPLTLDLSMGAVVVEFQLTDASFASYSTDLNGRFSAAPPAVGSAPGFVWADTNLDGVFTGAEQTNFGLPGGAYVRFSLSGTPLVPEPGTWALLVGGLGAMAMIGRRRRGGG